MKYFSLWWKCGRVACSVKWKHSSKAELHHKCTWVLFYKCTWLPSTPEQDSVSGIRCIDYSAFNVGNKKNIHHSGNKITLLRDTFGISWHHSVRYRLLGSSFQWEKAWGTSTDAAYSRKIQSRSRINVRMPPSHIRPIDVYQKLIFFLFSCIPFTF